MMNIETSGLYQHIHYKANVQNRKTANYLETTTAFNSVVDVDTKIDQRGKPSQVADRWTDVSLYTFDSSPKGYSVNKDVLLKVKEQLKAEGIDADSRTPTHEITAEQLEWLNSKYDLDFFGTCSITNEEFGNFMLDLAYLNVFSLEEVENMYAGVIPPQADYQAISIYYNGDPEDGSGAGYIPLIGSVDGNVVNEDMPTDHISNYLKAEYPHRTETEYQQMTAEFATQFQNRLKILEEIFEYFSYRLENNAILKIEEASEKLKEDFGSIL